MAQAVCDNCGQIWREDDLRPVTDLIERIEPGGTVPAGECPGCGALAYLVDRVDYG